MSAILDQLAAINWDVLTWGALVYFIPCMIALWRDSPDLKWIFFLNLFGWTGVGWLWAFLFAIRPLGRRG